MGPILFPTSVKPKISTTVKIKGKVHLLDNFTKYSKPINAKGKKNSENRDGKYVSVSNILASLSRYFNRVGLTLLR